MSQPSHPQHGRPGLQTRPLFRLGLLLVMLLGLAALPVTADEGWTIERFHTEIAIQRDGSLRILEAIDVDFRNLRKHGIFREIPVQYDYDREFYRVYGFSVESVADAAGKPWKYTRDRHGANEQLKIGDPDRTVSGRQTYRIAYRIRYALNAFADHDELYWNVNGPDWPVPFGRVSATVLLAGGALERAACFQGYSGSTAPCDYAHTPDRIEYTATRPFRPGEQLTIVAALRKGAVAEPSIRLEEKPRTFVEYFKVNAGTVGAALLLFVGGLVLLGRNWWAYGRDRRYTTLYYLTENPAEETRPLFKGDTLVVEFQPPEGLRPAQMGLLLDERADTKDVTATIVDLAVRGYLRIAEVPPQGLWQRLFRRKGWTLTRTRHDTNGLEPYEAVVFDGLFEDGDEVRLSALKNRFYKTLNRAQELLYRDAAARKWFSGNPEKVRGIWAIVGVVTAVVGGGLIFALGRLWGAGIAGVPVVLLGLLLFATHRAMPRRTARGSELLRRTLGFRRYIATAETERQRFNEQVGIFAEYLPYAIVFGCVEKWVRAFGDIDTAAATAGWYSGTSSFSATHFSRSLAGFSSHVSNTIASTPGSSGRSGFSGGSAGGGGGGGGGGSW